MVSRSVGWVMALTMSAVSRLRFGSRARRFGESTMRAPVSAWSSGLAHLSLAAIAVRTGGSRTSSQRSSRTLLIAWCLRRRVGRRTNGPIVSRRLPQFTPRRRLCRKASTGRSRWRNSVNSPAQRASSRAVPNGVVREVRRVRAIAKNAISTSDNGSQCTVKQVNRGTVDAHERPNRG